MVFHAKHPFSVSDLSCRHRRLRGFINASSFAASSGSVASYWQSADGYSVSSIDVNAWPSGSELDSYSRQGKRGWLNHNIVEMLIDPMLGLCSRVKSELAA